MRPDRHRLPDRGRPSAVAGSPAAVGDCPTSEPAPLPAGESRNVTINTDLGEILIHVEGALSPIAAGNFVALAECGFYDGVVFHRVVPGFVIQGGDGQFGRSPDVDPSLVGTGGPGYTITDEPVTAIYARGIVAMARTQQPNSVGSQFFIVLDDEARTSLEAPTPTRSSARSPTAWRRPTRSPRPPTPRSPPTRSS